MRILAWSLLLLALGLSTAVRAADDRDRLLSLIGTADLIVVGTVTASAEFPDAPAYRTGEATIAIERVVKGPGMEEVHIRYDTLRKMGLGASTIPEPQVLTPKTQQLFFLQQAQGGYSLAGTFREKLLTIGDTDRIAELVTALPVEVTLTGPQPWITFGQSETVRVHVKNLGQAPLQITGTSLTAYPLSELLGYTRNITSRDRGRAVPVTLQPGQECDIEVRASCPLPDACKAYPAESYARFPYCLRAEVSVSDMVVENPTTAEESARLQMGHRVTVASPWVLTTIGFPLPK